MIPSESIIVFWNTVMFILALEAVLIPTAVIILLAVDKFIIKPEVERRKSNE